MIEKELHHEKMKNFDYFEGYLNGFGKGKERDYNNYLEYFISFLFGGLIVFMYYNVL